MKLDRNGKILVCGSIAYNTTMVFDGLFREYILPADLKMLNVDFKAADMRRDFGGSAGNICYNLNLLGLRGFPVAAVGRDFGDYRRWMAEHNIPADYILEIEDGYTCRKHVITDMDNNRISDFHAGAMEHCREITIRKDIDIALGVVAPDSYEAMQNHTKQLSHQNVPLLLDPGEQVSVLDGTDLMWLMEHSRWMVLNEGDWQMFARKTNMRIDVATEMLDALIITNGIEGSVIHTRDNRFNIPAVPTEDPVDSTGCGDAYRAGIIFGLMMGHDWPTTGRIASLMATRTISHQGPQNHRVTLKQLREHFASQFMITLG
ncbi:carbohydrate kinase family protein [Emcibacter nanhaiensis]|uniref:Carbohydrate kinase family protein n=1 Tax=Emcibacter nanhaiensis TaxID=1505037 RepID=A0A501PMA1_9PROT|nr:carbohydrate kinase family protein [Emcibacter nanhaiensis]TPD61629.1 carbohydrate kinase family protein [Emcibacter nanhaiensis]